MPEVSWGAVLDRMLIVAGVAVIAVLAYANALAPVHGVALVFGILFVYAGSRRLVGRLLRQRANRTLRAELGHFTELVRQLYTSRTTADAARAFETKAELRESFERIISAAVYQLEAPDAGEEVGSAGPGSGGAARGTTRT